MESITLFITKAGNIKIDDDKTVKKKIENNLTTVLILLPLIID